MSDTAQHWIEIDLDGTEPSIELAGPAAEPTHRDWIELQLGRARRLDDPDERAEALLRLVGLLLDVLEQTDDRDERIHALRKVVAIYENDLDDPTSAFTVALAAFHEDVTRELSWCELERLAPLTGNESALRDESVRAVPLLEEAAPARGALATLAAVYRWSECWGELADTLRRQAGREPNGRRAARILLDSADVIENRLGHPEQALSAYREALDRDPRCGGAIAGLEWLYRRLDMTDELLDLYYGLAVDHEHFRSDDERAEALYRKMLELDPSEPRALDALARIAETNEDWERAIAMLSRLADVHRDLGARVALHRRASTIYRDHLDDDHHAADELRIALELDPTSGPCLEDMARLRHRTGDRAGEAELLASAADVAPNDARRVRLLCEAARLFAGDGDEDRATELFERAFALDAECIPAAEGLAGVYAERREWARLEPVIALLARKATETGASSRELSDLHLRAARCARELGKCRSALRHFDAAIALGNVAPAALLDRAAVLYELRDWNRAAATYREVRARFSDTLSPEELIRIGCCLGSICHARGERDKALAELRQVLEVDPHHSEALKLTVEIERALGNWRGVVRASRARLVRISERERPNLLREIAGLLRDRLDRPVDAIDVYRELLAGEPANHHALQSLIELHVGLRQWFDALEMIEKFAAVEDNAFRRGKLFQTAGTICREELGDADRARDYLEAALDCFFHRDAGLPLGQQLGCLRAFAMIDEILTETRDFHGQARAYERMLGRLPERHSVRPRLLHALGEIYRTRLRQPRRAIAAFEAASELDPPNSERAAILSELYAQVGHADAGKSAAEYLRLLETAPHDVDSYRALRAIFTGAGEYDRAWSTCGVLVALGRATRDERRFYEEYRPRALPRATHPLDEGFRTQLRHPREVHQLSAVFRAIARAAALAGAHRHKDIGLDPRERRELAGDQLHFSRILGFASYVLGVPLPQVYLQPDERGGILISNTAYRGCLIPSLIARRDVLQGCSAREIAFSGARTLMLFRPEHYMRVAMRTKVELRAALLSAIAIVDPGFSLGTTDRALVSGYAPKLSKRLTGDEREQLERAVRGFLAQSDSIDLAGWCAAVDFAAHRAGLLVAGDVCVAAALVRAEPQVVGEPTARDKLGQLFLYAVSEQHAAARRNLGWAIE